MKAILRFAFLFLTLPFVCGLTALGQSANFYLRDGDRMLFYGDSITEQAFYTNFIETYVVTRFPKLRTEFINSGWSGDRVWGGGGGTADERLKRDVFAHKPTVITLMFGMNDGCYMEFNQDCFKAYRDGYRHIISSLKTTLPRARITLLQPSPFDDWTDSHAWRLGPPVKGGYNDVMVRYGQFVKELAKESGAGIADMNAPLVGAIQKAQAVDHELAQKIVPDRIHPGTAGGLVMAAVLLKSWNAPATVSAIEIDAASGKTTGVERTKIADLRLGKGISWTQTDEALPFPLDNGDKALVLAATLAKIVDDLDRQMLTVNNLSAARYKLTIDGEEIAIFTKEELAKGVNLTVLPTPMASQAADVHRLTQEHNKVHFLRWREVQIPFEKDNPANASKAIAALDAMEAEIVKKQRATAIPKPRRFELVPQ